MAYQTGTSSSINDLLDKFRLFAEGQGWATNRWAVAGSGRELCISKGGAYFNFRAYSNETMPLITGSASGRTGMLINGSDGYDPGLAWNVQPGFPGRGLAGTSPYYTQFPLVTTVGPFPAYHFFAPDSKCLYAEVEITTGCFMRFGCGALDLFAPSTPGGGRFCFSASGPLSLSSTVDSSNWLGVTIDNTSYQLEHFPFRGAGINEGTTYTSLDGSMLRVDTGTYNTWATSGGYYTPSSSGATMVACGGSLLYDEVFMGFSVDPINQVAITVPCTIGYFDNGFVPVGTLPGIRYVDIKNYLPGDEFSFGPDTWKVFPWYQKNGLSLNRGIAYKKVV